MATMTTAEPAATVMDAVAVVTSVVPTISRIGRIGVRELIGSVVGVSIVCVIAGVEAASVVAFAIMAAAMKAGAVKASAMEAAAPAVKAPTAAAVGLGLVGKTQCTQTG
jgi:hypothetical protein